MRSARAGKSRIKASHGSRARDNGVPSERAPADAPTAAPDAPPDGHAAAPAAGSVTGPQSNGSHAGTGRSGADGAGAPGTGADGPGAPGSGPGSPGVPRGGSGGRRGGAGFSSLKNWRVRSRLLLLIAIPTVTALVLGGVRIASATQSALSFQRAEQRAVLAADVTQLVQRLETERDQTVYFIALGSSGRPGYLIPLPASKSSVAIKQYQSKRSAAVQQYQVIQAFYRQTDQAIAHFHALLAQYHNAYSSAAEQRVSSALAGLGDLRYLRYASTRTQL
ncbi:MAG TPA: hypothetical protein VGI05_00525, partial [Streptosporangiaceae bacterium]